MHPSETGSDTGTAIKPVIGLLGGVGAGKSTVAAELGRLGCAVIDGDGISHELLREPDIRQAVRQRWGDDVLAGDGSISRPALGDKVFADPAELAALNSILHPRIRGRIEKAIDAARRNDAVPAIVLDAAVLLEAGWDDLCTHLVFVSATDEQRADRTAATRGWEPARWQAREKSQIPLDSKQRRCYFVLDNSSSSSCLHQRVRRLFEMIVPLADRPRR